jgi:hypothetical protein
VLTFSSSRVTLALLVILQEHTSARVRHGIADGFRDVHLGVDSWFSIKCWWWVRTRCCGNYYREALNTWRVENC